MGAGPGLGGHPMLCLVPGTVPPAVRGACCYFGFPRVPSSAGPGAGHQPEPCGAWAVPGGEHRLWEHRRWGPASRGSRGPSAGTWTWLLDAMLLLPGWLLQGTPCTPLALAPCDGHMRLPPTGPCGHASTVTPHVNLMVLRCFLVVHDAQKFLSEAVKGLTEAHP